MFELAFLCMYGIGFCISCLFLPQLKFLEKIGLAFGIGLGVVTLIIFILAFFQRYSPANLFIAELLILFPLAAFSFKQKALPAQPAKKKFDGARNIQAKPTIENAFCFFLIVFLAISSFAFSAFFPIMEADGYHYSAFGRLVSQNNSLLEMQELQGNLQRTLLLQLSYTFVDSFDGLFFKRVHPFFYISLLLVFYYRAIDLVPRKKQAILLTSVLAATPILWWHGTLSFNNLATGYYFSIGTFFMFSGILKKDRSPETYIGLAGLFYALSIWTRLEFLFYFLIPLLMMTHFSIKSGNLRLPFYLAFFPLVLGASWSFYIHSIISDIAGFSFSDVLVLTTIVLILIYTQAYGYYGKLRRSSRPPVWIAWAADFKKKRATFCSRHLKSIIALLALLFILGEFKVLEGIAPGINYYLVSAESRFFQTIMQHGYWVFTNCLLFIFLFRGVPVSREIKYLFFFLLSLIVFHNGLYMIIDAGRMFGRGALEIIKTHLLFPGKYINGSSSRELISFYPIVIFGVAMALKNIVADNAKAKAIEKRLDYFLQSVIILNCMVLIVLFFQPKLKFMMKHYGESKRELLVSEGSQDIPNAFRTANQWAYRIKDLTPKNAVIIVPLEHSLGLFSTLNILLPRKIIWFPEKSHPNPSIYTQQSERPVYAIAVNEWKPLAPFEVIESFNHKEFQVSLVKITTFLP